MGGEKMRFCRDKNKLLRFLLSSLTLLTTFSSSCIVACLLLLLLAHPDLFSLDFLASRAGVSGLMIFDGHVPIWKSVDPAPKVPFVCNGKEDMRK